MFHLFIHTFISSLLSATSPHILRPQAAGHLPNSPHVPALAGAADLPMEVLLELQAGIRGVPLEKDRQTDGHCIL